MWRRFVRAAERRCSDCRGLRRRRSPKICCRVRLANRQGISSPVTLDQTSLLYSLFRYSCLLSGGCITRCIIAHPRSDMIHMCRPMIVPRIGIERRLYKKDGGGRPIIFAVYVAYGSRRGTVCSKEWQYVWFSLAREGISRFTTGYPVALCLWGIRAVAQ